MWLTPLHRAVASRSEVKKKQKTNVYFNLQPDYHNFFTCPWTVFWLFAEAAAHVGLGQTTSCNCQLMLNVTLQMSTSLAYQNGLFPSGDRAVRWVQFTKVLIHVKIRETLESVEMQRGTVTNPHLNVHALIWKELYMRILLAQLVVFKDKLPQSLLIFTSGGGPSSDSPLSRRERARQELADAAARRRSQQRSALCRGDHPAPEQRQRVGPRRAHCAASRCPQWPH